MDSDRRARVRRLYQRFREHAVTRWWRRKLHELFVDLELRRIELRRIELWQQREQQPRRH